MPASYYIIIAQRVSFCNSRHGREKKIRTDRPSKGAPFGTDLLSVLDFQNPVFSFRLTRRFARGLSVITAKIADTLKAARIRRLGDREASLSKKLLCTFDPKRVPILDGRDAELLLKQTSEGADTHVSCLGIP